MHRIIALIVCLVSVMTNSLNADPPENEKQFVELRYYLCKSAESAKQIDSYLVDALIPALNRAGSQTVGIFREPEEQSQPIRLVVIPHDSIAGFASLGKTIAKDQAYQSSAKTFLSLSKEDTPVVRITSELLDSFDSWPKLKMSDETKVDGRIFELRIYESSTDHFGNLKVEMFNSGEVPIFLDCGIAPVFMGQAIAGDKMPNLTYLTVYKNQAAKDEAWAKFREHPDWKVMAKLEKFKGTVSKIHKLNLLPVKGSQL